MMITSLEECNTLPKSPQTRNQVFWTKKLIPKAKLKMFETLLLMKSYKYMKNKRTKLML